MSKIAGLRHRRRGVLTCFLLWPLAAFAEEHGTAPEAEAMVKRAIDFIQTQGASRAYEEITHGSTFKVRDLHVVVYTLAGKNLAHGANSRTVGKDRMDLEDPDGKPIVKHFVEIANIKGKGWSEDYKLLNPATRRIEGHSMYIERLGDTFVGCGIYKPLEAGCCRPSRPPPQVFELSNTQSD